VYYAECCAVVVLRNVVAGVIAQSNASTPCSPLPFTLCMCLTYCSAQIVLIRKMADLGWLW
jgi:hypothetical protein